MHGKSTYKTLLIWPYAIAPAVVGVMANYFFSERFGLLYHLFNNLWGFNWYESVFDSYIYLIIAGSWKQISDDLETKLGTNEDPMEHLLAGPPLVGLFTTAYNEEIVDENGVTNRRITMIMRQK